MAAPQSVEERSDPGRPALEFKSHLLGSEKMAFSSNTGWNLISQNAVGDPALARGMD